MHAPARWHAPCHRAGYHGAQAAALRQVARAVLTALNFKVLTAADGTEALIQVAEKRAEIRAVITDLHLPNLDGLTFVRVLQQLLPEAGSSWPVDGWSSGKKLNSPPWELAPNSTSPSTRRCWWRL